MLTLMDTPPFLEDMEKKSKQLAQSIAQTLAGKGNLQMLVRESELLTFSPSSLIHIVKGVFRCQHGEKTIRLFSSGDLVLAPGPGEAGDLGVTGDIAGAGGIRITSEFGAEIEVLGREEFLNLLTSDRNLLADWLAYQNIE